MLQGDRSGDRGPYLDTIVAYKKFGFRLVLEHPPGHIRRDGTTCEGKEPVHKGYRKSDISISSAAHHMDGGGNIGVIPPEDVVVLDFDVKGFFQKYPEGCGGGDITDAQTLFDSEVSRVCNSLGVKTPGYSVLTGERDGVRGAHVYVRVPTELRPEEGFANTLASFPWVEVKTSAKKIAMPTSRHRSGVYYEAVGSLDDISDVGEAFVRGARAGVKKERTAGDVVRVTDEEIADILKKLEPQRSLILQDADKFFNLMAGIHSGSGGRESARDLLYLWSGKDGTLRRWDSFDPGRTGGVTIRSIYAMIAPRVAHRIEEILAPYDPEEHNDTMDDPDKIYEVFDLPTEAGDGYETDIRAVVEAFNRRFTYVKGEKNPIYYLHRDPKNPSEMSKPSFAVWKSVDIKTFVADYDVHTIELPTMASKSKTAVIGAGTYWAKKCPERKTAQSVTFDPGQPHKDHLNLWRGFSVRPIAGDVKIFQELVRESMCGGVEDQYTYMMRWLAYCVQNPGELADVACILTGKKGCGKSLLGTTMSALFGAHGRVTQGPGALFDKFDSRFRLTCFLFANECALPKDVDEEARLKAKITDKEGEYRAMRQEYTEGRNRLKIMIGTNDKHIVNASGEERRYFLPDVSDRYVGDTAFFSRYVAWRDNGGYSHLLDYLQKMPLAEWHPRLNVPQTATLRKQKLASMTSAMAYAAGILVHGRCCGATVWQRGDTYPGYILLDTAFREFQFKHPPVRGSGVRPMTDTEMAGGIVEVVSGRVVQLSTDGDPSAIRSEDVGKPAIVFPPRGQAWDNFTRCVGVKPADLLYGKTKV